MFAERRLCMELSGPGYLADTFGERYFGKGQGMVSGAVGATSSLVFEGTDQAISRLLGEEYVAPHGVMGRMRRDTGMAVRHLFSGHFIKAGADAWRTVFTDAFPDAVDLAIGRS